MFQSSLYDEVRNWMYRNARPLDFALWRYHFEGGDREEVLLILGSYQNEDGGFGSALEADSWNPNSAPIQTFHAVEILREINFNDASHPLVQGILKYLASEQDTEGDYWMSNIRSNNDYPHAPWWHMGSASASHDSFNPSAGLAGFALCYGEKDSELYRRCERIARTSVEYLFQSEGRNMHVLNCFIALAEYCRQAKIKEWFDLDEVTNRLVKLVQETLTRDVELWANSYVCKPSQFFYTPESIFYPGNEELAAYECEFIKNTRKEAGVWEIPWGWTDYPEEWAVSKNWWKGQVALKNMRYLYHFKAL